MAHDDKAGPMITYPTGWLLAVIDDAVQGRQALTDLAAAGFAGERSRLLVGPDGRSGLGELGAHRTGLTRIIRAVQFTTMDQAPDFAWYEAALDGGRTVVAVQASSRQEIATARAALASHGAHFENHFGRFMTEEFSRWHGPEPDLPDHLRR